MAINFRLQQSKWVLNCAGNCYIIILNNSHCQCGFCNVASKSEQMLDKGKALRAFYQACCLT